MKRKIVLMSIMVLILMTLALFISHYIKINQNGNENIQISKDTDNQINKGTRSVVYNYEDYQNLPINYSEAQYAYDTSSPEKAVGTADYVFIGKINRVLKTEYRNPVEVINNGETRIVTEPYTVYSVDVIENIKGEIVKNQDIELVQYGGLNEDKSSYTFMEGMKMLNVGEYYIILPYTSSDGRLGISCETSIIALGNLEQEIVETLKNTKLSKSAIENEAQKNNLESKRSEKPIDIILKYIEATENPIIPEGKRQIKSQKYDVEFSK